MPATFSLIDGVGTTITENITNCAICKHGNEVLVRIKRAPDIIFKCEHVNGIDGHPSSPAWDYLITLGLPIFTLNDRLSLYRVDGNTLSFRRNLRLTHSLISWVHKAPGTYVYFEGDIIGAIEISKSGCEYYSPFKAGLPITHLAPSHAWF